MISKTILATAILAATAAAAAATWEPEDQPNTLTQKERAAGWRLLFDGTSFDGWRGFKKESVPSRWRIVDGSLFFSGQGERGDIMTDRQFGNFELSLEWKIARGGNSGIFFRVSEEFGWSWESGPEMQVLDNAVHRDGKSPLTSAGSNYALHAPSEDVTRPVGEWNQVRIVVRDDWVEHWLNGRKIVAYRLWDEEWERLVKASKFASMPGYGRSKRGHIVLQDHGDPVWFRSIKIKSLD